jgi:apolipoprotein N-acyltransferase
MSRLIKIVLAVSSGVMLSLAWLGFPGWMLFAAFLPLLALEDLYISREGKRAYFSLWGYVFITFLIWNGFTTWWIIHATPVGAFLAIVANTFLMTFFFMTAHWVRRHSSARLGYLAMVTFWITFEYCHFHWDIEWPWLILGNGFANDVKIIQWYSVTGALGGSVWIWLVNIWLYLHMKKFAGTGWSPKLSRSLAGLALLVIIPMVISLIQYFNYEEKSDPRKVLIIQPNIDPYSETHDEGAMNNKLNKFIQLTKAHLQAGTDYIVGPETVFEQDWNEARLEEYPAVRSLKELTFGDHHRALVIGASTYSFYPAGAQQPTATARKTRDGVFYDVFNTAIFMDNSGVLQTYHKSILVAGVEKMPFRKSLRFLDEMVINLGGTNGSLGIQDEPENFNSGNGDKIAPAICYESVFGGYLTEFIRKGGGVIFIITNDGWWKNTPGYRQHFSFARLRAIEMRRSIVRSANTGISGIINQRGDIVVQSSWWVEGAVTGEINMNHRLTLYARYGDYLGRIAAFGAVLILLALISTTVLRKIKNRINPNCVKPR